MAQNSNSSPVQPDPAEVRHAVEGWQSFTQIMFYAALGVIGILILMAIFLL